MSVLVSSLQGYREDQSRWHTRVVWPRAGTWYYCCPLSIGEDMPWPQTYINTPRSKLERRLIGIQREGQILTLTDCTKPQTVSLFFHLTLLTSFSYLFDFLCRFRVAETGLTSEIRNSCLSDSTVLLSFQKNSQWQWPHAFLTSSHISAFPILLKKWPSDLIQPEGCCELPGPRVASGQVH